APDQRITTKEDSARRRRGSACRELEDYGSTLGSVASAIHSTPEDGAGRATHQGLPVTGKKKISRSPSIERSGPGGALSGARRPPRNVTNPATTSPSRRQAMWCIPWA